MKKMLTAALLAVSLAAAELILPMHIAWAQDLDAGAVPGMEDQVNRFTPPQNFVT